MAAHRLRPDLLLAALSCLAFPALLAAVRFFGTTEKAAVGQIVLSMVQRFKSVPQGRSGR